MARKVYFGVKAGVNLAQLRLNDYPAATGFEKQMKTSAHGGFLVNIPLGAGGFALQPELLYNGLGSKLSQNVTTTVGTTTTTTRQAFEQDLHYISLPIMAQWKSMGGFGIELGPQVSYLVKATQDGPNGTETDNKAARDNFDLAVGAGVGYTSRVGLGLGVRYNYGLTNTLEDGGGNNSPNNGPEQKNSWISISLKYLFGAGK